MDTPGGLDQAMRDMVQAIIASPVPIVTYVTPSGARAASAGTYILYASHVAAMAPATNLGAATPIQIGGNLPDLMPEQSDDQAAAPQPQTTIPQPQITMQTKAVNDAVAYIQSLADLRGRNKVWAEKAVREGASLAAKDALEKQVIDLIAVNLDELLQQLHGRLITKVNGHDLTLNTRNLIHVTHEPDWRNKFLTVITDPSVAYILLLIGFYGLLFEFYQPGLAGPGIIGAICLLIALYAFQILPISYIGLGLILLGIVLMVAEGIVPSFGIWGIGGVVSFVLGSITLMDSRLPAFQIALPVIVAVTIVSVTFILLLMRMFLRSRTQAVVSGLDTVIGQTAVVELCHQDTPLVRLQGELWQVSCQQVLVPGDLVIVRGVEGLRLQVEKLEN